MGSTIDSAEPEYSDEGVDLTLIRRMQSLTPREQLEFPQDQSDSLTALRETYEAPIPGNPEGSIWMCCMPEIRRMFGGCWRRSKIWMRFTARSLSGNCVPAPRIWKVPAISSC
jgi:hypothetical protein